MSDIHQSNGQSVSNDPAKGELPKASAPDIWKDKTSAHLLDENAFLIEKDKQNLHVVGVTGFSGQWSDAKIAADEGIKSDAAAATASLHEYLSELKAKYGEKLVVSSGATNEGVPKIIYSLCESLGIKAMGVTSAKAADYPLGRMDYLIVMGEDWGQESPTFLNTSDEFILLGGGGQAKREAIAAAALGKTVAVFQGYKGSGDQVTLADVPTGKFIARH
jgi:hypothetical protein